MIKLPETICTPEDLTELLLEVREYAKWYEHESVKQRSGVKSGASTQPVLSVGTTSFLRGISANGTLLPAQLEAAIKELEAYKATAPVITITLAAPAPGTIRTQLTTWCRETIAPGILVSFEYNRTLLGGMVVRYGSHVHDWSWRRALMNAKTPFSEVLARV